MMKNPNTGKPAKTSENPKGRFWPKMVTKMLDMTPEIEHGYREWFEKHKRAQVLTMSNN